MLRQLVITKRRAELYAQREQTRAGLAEYETRKAELEKREAELEAAVNEVNAETSAEDRATIDQMVEEYEADKKAYDNDRQGVDETLAKLDDQISALDAELDEINARTKTPAPTKTIERKDDEPMNTRKFFGMSAPERDAFLAREDVKGFLTRLREMKGQNRAVSGAELTIPTVTSRLRSEALFLHKTVTAQGHYILHSEIAEIGQFVLHLLLCCPRTDEMGNHLNLEFVHNGGAHRRLADASALQLAQETSVRLLLEDIFVAVVGDIDVWRVELHKGPYAVQQFRPADGPLRRNHLKGNELPVSF